MSVYEMIEGGNMAKAQFPDEIAVLTPRIEAGDFSSIFDETATLASNETSVRADGQLTNLGGETAGAFSLETRFDDTCVHFHVFAACENATFVLPIVSSCDETVEWSPHRVSIQKSRARIVVESSAEIRKADARVFHFVPGVQALRLVFAVPVSGINVSLTVVPNG